MPTLTDTRRVLCQDLVQPKLEQIPVMQLSPRSLLASGNNRPHIGLATSNHNGYGF